MKIFKVLIYVLFFWTLCSSCSPQQRIARIAKKYNLTSTEIVEWRDTVYIPAKIYHTVTILDSLGRFSYWSDSIVYYGFIQDSLVHITVEVPADTIYIVKEIPVQKIEIKPKERRKGNFWTYLLTIAFIFVSIIHIINYKRK